MKLNLGRDSEARFGQDFEAKFYGESQAPSYQNTNKRKKNACQ